MIWYFIEYFIDIVEAITIIIFLNGIYKKRYKSASTYFIGGFMLTNIIFGFNYLAKHSRHPVQCTSITMIILLFVVVYWLYKEPLHRLLISYIGLLIFIIAIEGIVLSLLSIAFKQSPGFFAEQNIFRVVGMFTSKLLIFLIVIMFISFGLKNGRLIVKKRIILEIVVLFSINLSIMISILPVYKNILYVHDENGFIAGIVILGLGFINILSLLIYLRIIRQAHHDIDLQLRLQQYDMQSKYLDEINYATMKLRSLRHDMSNHLGNVQGLVRYKEYDKLEEYLSKLLTDIEDVDQMIITRNPAISALLNRKKTLADKHDIHCSMNIQYMDEILMDDLDLCIVLGNILDNAIEASLKLEQKDRYIKIDIRNIEKYIIIDCVNRIAVNSKSTLQTTKDNKILHGIGLSNVKQIVKKYHGSIDISSIKDYFTITITMYNDTLDNSSS
ncbi:GHKL domain-containing protein [Vallitalea pronyensis]|uniref:GHKL domain-containing protein n=1 Tax=Vallitalea pronyensis TaxID=1348613 RepID=A0A8J8MGK4_9FIRM|nr:sensor histidine kinase [Vallitalea pronyensis]QUI21407.1 GHKL domain-containing protein [Vallitalea pronyensis]